MASVARGSASTGSWVRRKPAVPSGVPIKLPSTRTPSLLKGMSGGRQSVAGRSADHAAHFAGLWERPMCSMAAVKSRNAEVQASGSPTKVTSSA
ncbi:hypothetical protein CLOM_g23535 [Closterium sp. NIES-68]|nr:hypothetical protein CLOM_g23535 [Closterium sp. NIES-68]